MITSLIKGLGGAAFNFASGTVKAGSSFSTTVPLALTGTAGNATVDTSGYSVTLSGQLSDTAGLTKTGGGVLALGS